MVEESWWDFEREAAEMHKKLSKKLKSTFTPGAYFACCFSVLLVEMEPAENRDLNNPKITWHLSKCFLFTTNPLIF